MTGRTSLLAACVLGLGLAGCSDPTGFSTSPPSGDNGGQLGPMATEPEQCPANPAWLPTDGSPPPPQDMFTPVPHPNSECPFYSGGWQNFLMAMAGPDGNPAIASYLNIEDVFTIPGVDRTKLEPIGQHRGNKYRSWLGVVHQAGHRNILVDQDGRTVYYGIHVNQAFADFIHANQLETAAAIQNADAQLYFPEGVVEFKSAWKDIDVGDGMSADRNAQFKKNYIWTQAYVPTLSTDSSTGLVVEHDDQPRGPIDVALVGIHVVYTFPGHPEFVWTSFEHVDLTQPNITTGAIGRPNLAPTFSANPDAMSNADITTAVSKSDFLFYKGGSTPADSNTAVADSDLGFDDATQIFAHPSNIYRMFPGSKSNDVNPDDAVAALNGNMTALFAQNRPTDLRSNYRLLGGTWMDKPQFFVLDSDLQNDGTSPLVNVTSAAKEAPYKNINQDDERTMLLAQGVAPLDNIKQFGSDSPFSILAGEDSMSNMSMESFTQAVTGFPNCFSCHNTKSITAAGTGGDVAPPGTPIMVGAKLIGVSHVLTEVIGESCTAPPAGTPLNSDGSSPTWVCPQ